jgi:hypothetical protein
MAYGICRISKLKGGGIAASELHTLRKRETPNANPDIDNIRFIGQPYRLDGPNLETLVKQRIGEQHIRSNAVQCVEMLLTASPEYFRPNNTDQAGYYDSHRLQEFQQATHRWLERSYGDRIVRAELHLDEATPHVHAYLVPLDNNGKLNCRALFGGREKLHHLQDSFAQAVEHLGLERGIKGSRANHTEIKEYYAAIKQPPDLELDTNAMHQQLADRRRALKEHEDMRQTAHVVSSVNEQQQRRIQELESQLAQTNQQASDWRRKYQDLVNQVRDVPLPDVAYQLGLEPDPHDKHKWRNDRQIININGPKFYDFISDQGGGGAIDLVMHVNQCNFNQAVAWLQDRYGGSAVAIAATYHAQQIAQTERLAPFQPLTPDEQRWPQVRDYLIQQRKLPPATVDELHQRGLIYADARQNLVSLCRELPAGTITGASLRGTQGPDNHFKGLAPGSNRAKGWFYYEQGGYSSDPPQRIVLTESAIDAMSFAALDRNRSRRTLYLSTDGAGQVPVDYLQQFRERQVVIAFDNDDRGQQMAQKLHNELPNAIRTKPQRKDWNDDLRHRHQSKSSELER